MPVNPTYPGVYIDELPSAVRTITGVPTAIAAFVGPALRGPVDEPRHITSWADFERIYGGLWAKSLMSYAVYQYYQNGGSEAEIVRIVKNAKPATLYLGNGVILQARYPGAWGNRLRVRVEQNTSDPNNANLYNLTVRDAATGAEERYLKIDTAANSPRRLDRVLQRSSLAQTIGATNQTPPPSAAVPGGKDPFAELSDFFKATGAKDADITAANTAIGKAATDAATADAAQADANTAKAAADTAKAAADAKAKAAADAKAIADKAAADAAAAVGTAGEAAAKAAADAAKTAADAAKTAADTAKTAADTAKTDADTKATKAGTDANTAASSAAAAASLAPYTSAQGGGNGDPVGDAEYVGSEARQSGMYALLKTNIFNIMCIPPIDRQTDFSGDTLTNALNLCVTRRAILLVDPPVGWTDLPSAVAGANQPPVSGDFAKNAAIYFPRIKLPDPQQGGQIDEFPPSGAIAGIFARTDAQRGVWKAPAGTDASLSGVSELSVKLTDLEQGQLNPLGVNCLRNFNVIGSVVWGARTLRGADALADQWKYVPVRRLALYIEESLYRGTQWVVFEPNDEPLWSQIRLNVGSFMNTLFRQGAFQGRTPREAYLVKCDKENNPQNDIDRGIVNILVGFAPLKPAEFVIIHIQQLAGQIQV